MTIFRRVLVPFSILILAVAVTAQTGKAFVDKSNGYSVEYPINFKLSKGKLAKSETAFGDPGAGKKLVKAEPKVLARKYHGWYEFDVWKSVAADAKCDAPAEGEEGGIIPLGPPDEGVAKTIEIGGNTFNAYQGSEGGMSKSLSVFGYRGKAGGACWQIQEVTYQVSAFDDYKPFDDKRIRKEFLGFLKGFKLL